MMPAVYISTLLVLVAAAIEALRIYLDWGKTENIRHAISATIGTALCVGQWFVQDPGWLWYTFAGLCVGMRMLVYDPALNLMRRERLDYVSPKTNAFTATWWRRWNITFWQLRAAGAVLVGISLLIQFFL